MIRKKEITRRQFITTSSRLFIGGFIGIPIIDNYMTDIPVPTGFTDLDNLAGGLQKGELAIVGSRPCMGKSAFAINFALHAAIEKNIPVALFSLEMSKEQLFMRMLSSEARFNSSRLKSGFIRQDDWMKITEAAGTLSNAPIYIDDSPAISAMEIRAKARRLKMDKKTGLIIIDYLQLMKTGSSVERRDLEISDISEFLKALAKELDLPVVLLSQLNRKLEQRRDKRPVLSDLNWSGNIEPYADKVLFIYRDDYYTREDNQNTNIAEIILAKQRNGSVGTVKLAFTKSCARFENLC